jgi:hypothetical protein
MASLPALPDDVAFDICALWQSALKVLESQHKVLPEPDQLLDLLARGPRCAMDVLHGVLASYIRYPPGWLQWRMGRFPISFSVSPGIMEAFDSHLRRGQLSADDAAGASGRAASTNDSCFPGLGCVGAPGSTEGVIPLTTTLAADGSSRPCAGHSGDTRTAAAAVGVCARQRVGGRLLVWHGWCGEARS